jgi:hypothetical protein
MHREVVFVVRMWSEPGDDSPETWRGSVDSVGARRRQYFANLGAMCEFMLAERAATGGPGVTGEAKESGS